jgi:hypothetical protein
MATTHSVRSLVRENGFVQTLSSDQVKQIQAMIGVDRIGDRDLHTHPESHSNLELTDLIFDEARNLGYRLYSLERPLPVADDHMPFVRGGIDAVDLVSLNCMTLRPLLAHAIRYGGRVQRCEPGNRRPGLAQRARWP